jgi:hypothetical protein
MDSRSCFVFLLFLFVVREKRNVRARFPLYQYYNYSTAGRRELKQVSVFFLSVTLTREQKNNKRIAQFIQVSFIFLDFPFEN